MLKRILLCVLCLIASSEAAAQVDRIKHPVPIIFDTDCDLDDMMAIAYLVKNPRVDLKAITTVGTGLSHWENGAKNILNLLELLGHPNIPVAYGARESLSPVGHFPSLWRKQADKVSGIKLPLSPVQPVSQRSADLIIEIAMNSPQKISILCAGPLTNIAIALSREPKIKEKIEKIYIKGGAILSPGNLVGKALGFRNRVSEYNIFLDATAANQVLESEIPVTLIPIDVIEHVPAKPFYEKIRSNRKTPAANLVYEVLKPSLENKKRLREYLWEPAIAVLFTNPEIGMYRELKLKVYLKKGPEYARLLMTKRGVPTQVATSIDTKAFYKLFLTTLNRKPNLQSNHVQRVP